MIELVLSKYGIDSKDAQVESFGGGLINHTWKVKTNNRNYILQRINEQVFTKPEDIATNIQALAVYLKEHFPDYYFVSPVTTVDGNPMVHINEAGGGYYRLLPFVNDSHSKDVVTNAEQAFEAAAQFGKFTQLLSGFDAATLKITLPSFHDLGLRYQQFTEALQNGNQERITEAASLISFMKDNVEIVAEFRSIQTNPSFKKRVTHHDT